MVTKEKEYYYCEWREGFFVRKGFVSNERIGNDIPYHKILGMNGPHSLTTVNEFISKWGWGSLEQVSRS